MIPATAETLAETPAEPERQAAQVSAPDLAASLAARLCHDLISPASAITSGLDLLDDPSADLREEAMGLIAGSARKLVALLAFCRAAFGASAAAESFDAGELERLTRGVFEHVRPELDWAVEPATLDKTSARTLLNLAQLGAGALPSGGVARVSARTRLEGGCEITVEARGARPRVRPEVLTGLRGETLAEGLHGPWVQAFYVHALLAQAGGAVAAEVSDEIIAFRARTAP